MHSNRSILSIFALGASASKYNGKTSAPAALASAIGLMLALTSITSCSSQPPTNEQLQQKAAQATVRAKQDSKEAVEDARIAAAKAEGQVDAIASGVKEGIRANTGRTASEPASRVDLNTASANELAALPGISDAKAKQIIRRRPYRSVGQLVGRGLLSQSQFERIAADVTVK